MKIKIGYSKYELSKTKQTLEQDALGLVQLHNKNIQIYDGFDNQTKKQTFWHEFVHAALHEIDADEINENETFVNMFSKVIYAFLEDNSVERIYKQIGADNG